VLQAYTTTQERDMISIAGLTPKQKALMTVMWDMDSMDKVQSFIRTLTPADARDAHSLLQVAIWESIEQEDGLDAYADQADHVIASARN
jgi:hypothetical protein